MTNDTQDSDGKPTPGAPAPDEIVTAMEFLVTRQLISERSGTLQSLPATLRDRDAESDWEQSSTRIEGRVLSVVWTRKVKVFATELVMAPIVDSEPNALARGGFVGGPGLGVATAHNFSPGVPPTPGYAQVREHGSFGGYSVRERGVSTTVAPASGSTPLRPGAARVMGGNVEVSVRPYQGDLPPYETATGGGPVSPGFYDSGARERLALPNGGPDAFGAVAYRPRQTGVTGTAARGVHTPRNQRPLQHRATEPAEIAAPVAAEGASPE